MGKFNFFYINNINSQDFAVCNLFHDVLYLVKKSLFYKQDT